MSRGMRNAAAVLLAAILAWVGWLVIQTTRADALAFSDPEAALRIDPGHPRALLVLAWRQYGQGDDAAAMATARKLLAVEPGQGMAFAVLALAAERQGSPNADKLMQIALKRAPRNRDVRAQAAAAALQAGDLATGLAQLDALLRLAPDRGEQLFPALATQAANPGFAEALADILATAPVWKPRFLRVLERDGSPQALDNVYAGLQQREQLSEAEAARWLDRMIKDGRWGEAYAHWFSQLEASEGNLPPLYNGGFEQEPSQFGFDWRNTRAAGVFTDLEPAKGASGERAAHIHFIGREAVIGNLRQPLLLAPGRYRLSLRARAEFLHSEKGWNWTIRCVPGGEVARLGPLQGSFPWETREVAFSIPEQGCEGQWLELRNPSVAGSRQTGGDLWIDDMAITTLQATSAQ